MSERRDGGRVPRDGEGDGDGEGEGEAAATGAGDAPVERCGAANEAVAELSELLGCMRISDDDGRTPARN